VAATPRVVIDTNVLAGALLRREGRNRDVLRMCLEQSVRPIIGQKLFLEYEDVFGRREVFKGSPLSASERRELLAAFLGVCEWVRVFYLWRPNLRDEGDNHLVELAVAGGAEMIVTNNVADFRGPQLRFPDVRILRPADLLRELP